MDKDKKNAIKDLIEIRNTGLFNMFMDRKAVMQYANNNNHFSLVAYCGNNRDKYIALLKEDWSEIEEEVK